MFNKKRIEALEEKFDKLCNEQNEYEKQLKRLGKLERIVKYSKDDEPTFAFCNRWNGTKLYLYVNKEEYIIELKELYNLVNVIEETLEVHNERAYFTVTIRDDDDIDKQHLFIVDYLNDRYVLNSVINVEKE
jgi:hypothetical protein